MAKAEAPKTAAETLIALTQAAVENRLRPFTANDWAAYAGCEAENPQIASFDWGDLILSDDTVEVCVAWDGEGVPDGDSRSYKLTPQ